MERNAKCLYPETVQEAGLIISYNLPMFGCSLDGFVQCDDKIKSIEIKSVKEGKKLPATEKLCLETKKFHLVNNKLRLKSKNPWYGQVQFGLHLCQMKQCDLVMYSSCVNEDGSRGSIKIIEVEYDEAFCTEMFSILTNVYFEKFLPFLEENQDRLVKFNLKNV